MAQILVVDDSSTVRVEVSEFLKQNGLTVATAIDGRDGLSKLQADPGIRLIVSDVNMPNMDGISFVTQVKQHPKHRFIPVVMLTTEGEDEVKNRGRLAGAKAWMVKPFNPPQLLDAVSKLVLP